MKKSTVRIFAIVLVVLMCLSLLPLATVAHAEDHVHVFEPTTIPPTCGEEGYVQMICEACGFGTEIVEYLPPTGNHVFDNVVGEDYLFQDSDNFCEVPQIYWKACIVCGAAAEDAYENAKQRAIDELNQRRNNGEQHSDEEWTNMLQRMLDDIWANYTFTYGGEGHQWVDVEYQPATCEQDGWETYHVCSVCGKGPDVIPIIPATGHRWGEFTVVTEPTCETDGVRKHVCSVCNKEETKVIPALGHKYGEFTVTKAPTCTEDGVQERVCSVCGAVDTEVIPALGHKFGAFTVIKAPTCTEDGVQEHTCTVCGAKETEAIPAAHKFGEYVLAVEPGCYSSGEQVRTCTVCGETESEAIPAAHKFGEFVVTTEPTCYSTGERRSTCQVCGEEIVEWIDMAHKYENGVCVFCGEADPNYDPNAPVAAAAQEPEMLSLGLSMDDSETYDAASFNVTLTNTNSATVTKYPGYNIALKGDIVEANCDLGKTGLTYTWIYGDSSDIKEIVKGTDLTTYDTGDTSDGKPDLLDKYLVCVVTDPSDPNPLTNSKRSELIRIRQEVTISFTAHSGEATISCVRDTNDLEPLVITAADNVDSDKFTTYLTQDKITLHLDPNDGYLFRQIAYLNASTNTWVPQKTLADSNRDLELTVSTGTHNIWLLMADKADLYHSIDNSTEKPTNGRDDEIQKSKIADKELVNLLNDLGTQYGVKPENIGTSEIVYVTPVWSTGKLAMNDTEIGNTDGFRFRLPLPTNITKDDLVLAYHFEGNGSAGKWEKIPNSQLEVTDNVWVSNYKSFTPFVAVGLKNVKLILSPSETAAPEETTSTTHYKGAIVQAPKCDFDAPTGKTLDEEHYWKGSDNKYYKPGDELPELKEDFTLTAQWVDGYTVTFYKNDVNANGEMDPQYVVKNQGVKLNKNAFTLKNNDFVGWSTSSGGEKVYDDEQTIPAEELHDNLPLYAVWTRTYSTVTLDPNNDGADKAVEQTAPKNGSLTLKKISELKFTNGDKLFAGWANEDAPDAVVYKDGETIPTPGTDITLVAVWRNPVVIHFVANDAAATGRMAEQTVPSGVPCTLNANAYKVAGKSFDKWYTNATYSETAQTYEDAQEDVTFTGETYLYAKWEDLITVTFDPNGGRAVGTKTQEEKKGSSVNLTKLEELAISAPSYKEFDCWNTVKEPTNTNPGVKYPDGASFPFTENTTLYAQWKTFEVTIKFDANRNGGTGSGTMEDLTFNTDTDSMTLTKNSYTNRKTVPSRIDFSFMGWNTEKDSTGVDFADEDTITKADVIAHADSEKVVTLYAQWATAILFDGNGATSGSMDPQMITVKTPPTVITLNANKFSRTNYTFDSWNTKADGSGKSYPDGGNYSASTSCTLYAQWIKTSYAVNYDKNGGGGAQMAPDSVAKNEKGTVKENAYNAPNTSKVFGEWNTNKNGSGTIYRPGDNIMSDDVPTDITLYAQWKDKLEIWFNPGTGTGDAKKIEEPNGSKVKLPAYTDLGYKPLSGQSFAGWKVSGDDKIYKAGDTYTFTSPSQTVQAQWADTIHLTYNANGGTLTTSAGTKETYVSTIPQATDIELAESDKLHLKRDDYEFKGWALSSGANKPKDGWEAEKEPITVIGGFTTDTVIFAVWEKHAFSGDVTISGSYSGYTGEAYVGETLMANITGEKVFTEFAYQWRRDGEDIPGATSDTYDVTAADFGKDISCVVTALEASEGRTKTSNIKTVVIEEEEKRIVNNGETEIDYIYGLLDTMYYTVNNGVRQKVTLDSAGRFAVKSGGTYRFYENETSNVILARVAVVNWYTIGYAYEGSGTVKLNLGSSTITSSTKFTGETAENIEYYPKMSGYICWIVREGANIGTFTLTVSPSSGNYSHVYLNDRLLESFGNARTSSSSSSSSSSGSSSSSSSSSTISRTYTVNTPLEYDTKYTAAPWKMFNIIFNNSSSSPRTADESHLGLWSALCLISLTGSATILGKTFKRKKTR